MQKWVLACLFMLLCAVLEAAWAKQPVLIGSGNTLSDQYCAGLVKLALARSGSSYEILSIDPADSTLARQIEMLNSGKLSVIWTGTNRELEEQELPIRIPLFKGLLAHRILIIREGDQSRFSNVNTFEDLKKISFGQGTTWADTKVLEANNLKVVKTPDYNNLFFMLDGARFDAFPRGIHEIWSEVERRRKEDDLQLVAEQKIMLVYRMPMYFFVSPENKTLAFHLEAGLMTIISDGTFDEYFFSNPGVKMLLERGELNNRKVFELVNPDLPPETPLNDKALWLDLDKLRERSADTSP